MGSDVICCCSLFTARPLRAAEDDSLDLPRIGRSLHRHSRKAGPVPPPQFILLIEPDDDGRVFHAEYQHTVGLTVLTADTTDDGLSRASDADVIVTWIGVFGSFDEVELVRRVRQADRTKHTPVRDGVQGFRSSVRRVARMIAISSTTPTMQSTRTPQSGCVSVPPESSHAMPSDAN